MGRGQDRGLRLRQLPGQPANQIQELLIPRTIHDRTFQI